MKAPPKGYNSVKGYLIELIKVPDLCILMKHLYPKYQFKMSMY